MITRSAAARIVGSVILAGAMVLGTTGCTFIANQATLIQYDPSDGVGADIGTVQVRNALGLMSEDGKAISLMITFVNSGTRTVNVSMQYDADGERTTTTKSVNPGDVSTYGTSVDDTQIIILNSGVKLGALLPVYVQYGDFEGTQLMVPVMNADANPEYKDLLPPDVEG